MAPTDEFLGRVKAARRAAWQVFLVGIACHILTYLGYLLLGTGLVDGLIEAGVYGKTTRETIVLLTLGYLAVLKLMMVALLLAALFLTFWVRALRRS